jgi:acyl carrier protein
MPVNCRILYALREVTGKSYTHGVDWDTSLADLGMDSLEMLDFFHELEKEFNVKRLADGNLLNVKNLTLNAVKAQILSNLVTPASAE